MRAFIIMTIGSLILPGCFLLDGNLHRGKLTVILSKDKPDYYELGKENEPTDRIGSLDKLAGDTLATYGIYKGGIWSAHYLIKVADKEVYIMRSAVLTPDDQLYRRLSSKFKLKLSEDADAWDRALVYVKNHSAAPVEVANESLIKTKSTSDTTVIGYLITRVVQSGEVEYEIICKSLREDFDPNIEANQVAFYMATGRIYSYGD